MYLPSLVRQPSIMVAIIDTNIVVSPRPKVETIVGVTLQELLRDISRKNDWEDALAYVSVSISL